MKKYLIGGSIILICVLVYIFWPRAKRTGRTGLLPPRLGLLKKIPFAKPDTSLYQEMYPGPNNIIKYLPPAGDQKDQLSCVAFSLTYSLMSYYEKRINGYSYDIVNHIPNYAKVFSPAFVYDAILQSNSDNTCNRGIEFIDALLFIEKYGACKWNEFPYSGVANGCQGVPGKDLFLKAKPFCVFKFYQIPKEKDVIINYLKQDVPVIIGIYTSENMDIEGYKAPKSTPFIWNPYGDDYSDYHAMLCVGFDEKAQCFILANSWGYDWGQYGLCYIPYGNLIARTRELYIATVQNPKLSASESDTLNVKENLDTFERTISQVPDTIAMDANLHKIDSLFRRDMEMIRLKKSRSNTQESLLKTLERRISGR